MSQFEIAPATRNGVKLKHTLVTSGLATYIGLVSLSLSPAAGYSQDSSGTIERLVRESVEYSDSSDKRRSTASSLGVSIAFSFASQFETRAGPRRQSWTAVAIRRTWSLWSSNIVDINYVADLTPFALANTVVRHAQSPCLNDTPNCYRAMVHLKRVVGVGVSPIGAELSGQLTSRLSFAFDSRVGAFAFARPVPDSDASRLNLAVSATIRLGVRVDDRQQISISMSRLHLSNAGSARANPGVDANVVAIGWLVSDPL